ncbi:hypothetical protein PVAP13_5NG160981 [Panicum virgatum]|uniref:Uncharacterized protein n=1 Tax=Panicum virgatum TaxID=38727 RepID=A0A8T0RNN1_PANVG|nr:hypothetical protein PVAP13_5NG160981 [Panicum virgatum]
MRRPAPSPGTKAKRQKEEEDDNSAAKGGRTTTTPRCTLPVDPPLPTDHHAKEMVQKQLLSIVHK